MAVIALGILALAAGPRVGASFTQSGVSTAFGNLVPMGHEWITRLAALELLGGDPIMRPDPDDPRRGWKQGRAKNPDLSDAYARLEVTRIQAGTPCPNFLPGPCRVRSVPRPLHVLPRAKAFH